MKLDNKTVLVSGANRGIGKAIVEALLKQNVKKIYAGAHATLKTCQNLAMRVSCLLYSTLPTVHNIKKVTANGKRCGGV